MSNSNAKTTTPDDFVILSTYTNPSEESITGKFPVYVASISECCVDNVQNQEVYQVVIPKR